MLKFKYTTLAKPLGGNDLHSEASRYLMTDKTQLDIAFFYMVCTQLESDGGAKLTFLGNPPPLLGAHTCNKGQDCERSEFKNNYRASVQFFSQEVLNNSLYLTNSPGVHK